MAEKKEENKAEKKEVTEIKIGSETVKISPDPALKKKAEEAKEARKELARIKAQLKKAETVESEFEKRKNQKLELLRRLQAGTTKSQEELEKELAEIRKEKEELLRKNKPILDSVDKKQKELDELDAKIASLRGNKVSTGGAKRPENIQGVSGSKEIFTRMAIRRGFIPKYDASGKFLNLYHGKNPELTIVFKDDEWEMKLGEKKLAGRSLGRGSADSLDKSLPEELNSLKDEKEEKTEEPKKAKKA